MQNFQDMDVCQHHELCWCTNCGTDAQNLAVECSDMDIQNVPLPELLRSKIHHYAEVRFKTCNGPNHQQLGYGSLITGAFNATLFVGWSFLGDLRWPNQNFGGDPSGTLKVCYVWSIFIVFAPLKLALPGLTDGQLTTPRLLMEVCATGTIASSGGSATLTGELDAGPWFKAAIYGQYVEAKGKLIGTYVMNDARYVPATGQFKWGQTTTSASYNVTWTYGNHPFCDQWGTVFATAMWGVNQRYRADFPAAAAAVDNVEVQAQAIANDPEAAAQVAASAAQAGGNDVANYVNSGQAEADANQAAADLNAALAAAEAGGDQAFAAGEAAGEAGANQAQEYVESGNAQADAENAAAQGQQYVASGNAQADAEHTGGQIYSGLNDAYNSLPTRRRRRSGFLR
jgi:hypothetical protein